jgi:hypothetical protein
VNTPKTITLPAFLRRTVKAYALKAMMKEQGCILQRQGRSRNWSLTANTEQLQAIVIFIETNDEVSWLWLAKHLKQQYLHFSHASLISLAKQQNILTISKLMTLTDCTIAQARKVIDELEMLD